MGWQDKLESGLRNDLKLVVARARVAELEDEAVKLVARIGEMKLPSIDESNIASVKADLSIERARVAKLKQLLGGALMRLQELGDTEFRIPDKSGEGGR